MARERQQTNDFKSLYRKRSGIEGFAVTGGILLAASPLAFVTAVGVLISFLPVIRHAARAGLFTGLLVPLVLWLVRLRGLVTWISIPVGLVITARYTVDWKRSYRELWLDREKKA